MKKHMKYTVTAVLCSLVFLCLAGCKLGKTQVTVNAGFSENDVFKIKDQVCTLPEARGSDYVHGFSGRGERH